MPVTGLCTRVYPACSCRYDMAAAMAFSSVAASTFSATGSVNARTSETLLGAAKVRSKPCTPIAANARPRWPLGAMPSSSQGAATAVSSAPPARAAASRPHKPAAASKSPAMIHVGIRCRPRNSIPQAAIGGLGVQAGLLGGGGGVVVVAEAPPLQPRNRQHRNQVPGSQNPVQTSCPGGCFGRAPQRRPPPVLHPVPMCRTPIGVGRRRADIRKAKGRRGFGRRSSGCGIAGVDRRTGCG
ncbi:MAG: hypothetical protein JWP55_805 [Mycobacterium sp.]|nr:hypothetical protein [Mycobacterium sp.]